MTDVIRPYELSDLYTYYRVPKDYDMFENFTDRARKAFQLANQEAQRRNHEYVGAEHLLVSLLKVADSAAATALGNLGVTLVRLRTETEKLTEPGPNMITLGKLPQTPRTKKAIEAARQFAAERGDNWVGTGHLLVGLVAPDNEESNVVRALWHCNVTPAQVREEVLRLLRDKTQTVSEDKPVKMADHYASLTAEFEATLAKAKRCEAAEKRATECQARYDTVCGNQQHQIRDLEAEIAKRDSAIAALEATIKAPEAMNDVFVAVTKALMHFRAKDQAAITTLRNETAKLKKEIDPYPTTFEPYKLCVRSHDGNGLPYYSIRRDDPDGPRYLLKRLAGSDSFAAKPATEIWETLSREQAEGEIYRLSGAVGLSRHEMPCFVETADEQINVELRTQG